MDECLLSTDIFLILIIEKRIGWIVSDVIRDGMEACFIAVVREESVLPGKTTEFTLTILILSVIQRARGRYMVERREGR